MLPVEVAGTDSGPILQKLNLACTLFANRGSTGTKYTILLVARGCRHRDRVDDYLENNQR